MIGKTGHVMTLSNSIIGVGILAMPFCFQKCGIILSVVLLITSNFITRISCYYLVKSSILCRRKSFEIMAFHAFGSQGKLLVELSIIGFLMGTCVTYFVVLGDLGPQMVAKIFGIENNDVLRTWTMVVVTVFCVIPLGLLRNIDSLSAVCTASIGFYFCLVIKVMAESQNHFSMGDWINNVEYWKPSGVLQCLPIISMALFCQLQLFEVFETVQNVSLDKMYSIVKTATAICTGVYILVGFFGYIAYCTQEFSGNILLNFTPSITNDIMKIGFVLSIAFSFPLVIFPCRVSVYSLLYRRGHADVAHYIPEHRFKFITIALVIFGLVIGIMIPSVELVIGIVGSTIGIAICVMFPASCFIKISKKESTEKMLAQMLLVFGFFLMVLGTYANLVAIEEKTSGVVHNEFKLLKENLIENKTKNLSMISVALEAEQAAKKNNVKKKTELNLEVPVIHQKDPKKGQVRNLNIVPLPPERKTAKPLQKGVNANLDRDINKEAIQKEDLEMAIDNHNKLNKKSNNEINKSVNNKLEETKELLKEQVDEIKNELEKRNQETQKLVLEKFDQIVEKLEHKQVETNLNDKKTPINVDEIQRINRTEHKLRANMPKTPEEINKKLETNQTVQRDGIVKDKVVDESPAQVLKRVEEIVNKVEKIEQTQQEKRLRKTKQKLILEPKKDAVLEKVEKIAERVEKIQKVQEKENLIDLADGIPEKPVTTIAPVVQQDVKKMTTINNDTGMIVNSKENQKKIEGKGPDTHKLMQKIEEIVEKVEQIEQHQENELKIIQEENVDKKHDSAVETNKLVLKKIEEIGEKLDVIEMKQKAADMQRQVVANEPLQIAPTTHTNEGKIVNVKQNLTTADSAAKTKIDSPKNLTVDLRLDNKNEPADTNQTAKTVNTDLYSDKKNMPPIPIIRNAFLPNHGKQTNITTVEQQQALPRKNQENIVKNIMVTGQEFVTTQLPNQPRNTNKIQPETSDEKHVEAIRRDLLAINSNDNVDFNSKISNQAYRRNKRNAQQLVDCTDQNHIQHLCINFITENEKNYSN